MTDTDTPAPILAAAQWQPIAKLEKKVNEIEKAVR
jgi:hypothetical protein